MTIQELQPKLFETFTNIIQSGRLNHAYLFSGDFASLDMAIYIAKSIFCQSKLNDLPCQTCRVCRLIDKGEFPDLKIIEPSGQIIKTEVIKEVMKDFTKTGLEGEKQVFIIRDCDKMHINAANSLLKYIEEPQSQSYIFLLTSDDNKVLPTIKSRTQVFHFPKNRSVLLEYALQKGLLKTQADILVEISKDPKDLEKKLDSKASQLIQTCQKWVALLKRDSDQAYLEISKLVQQATDKFEQEMVFQILMIIFSKQIEGNEDLIWIEKIYNAQQMWMNYVSFQNALEYMILS
ncbi:DNA polymerase III subunit delta' [Streptococcus urinalis]|nr:DNA polymerase III subunit delta' [Streptococcus urinalis]